MQRAEASASEPRSCLDPFANVPRTPRQHFVLHFYAAVHHLLRLLRATGKASFEDFLERYPFLAAYLVDVSREVPESLSWSEIAIWWRRSLETWEQQDATHLPWRALATGLELDMPTRMALVMTGLVEEDARFGTLFAELQAPLPGRRPTLELLGRLAAERAPDETLEAWPLAELLVGNGLALPVDRDAPRAEWALRVVPALWNALRGEPRLRPGPGCRHRPAASFPVPEDLIADAATVRRAAALPAVLDSGTAGYLVLRADPGADATEVAGAVARRLGRGVLEVEHAGTISVETAAALGPLATTLHTLPVLCFQPTAGDQVEPPELKGYAGPMALVLGAEGGVSDRVSERSVTLELPFPTADVRRRIWTQAMDGRSFPALDAATERYHLSARFIRRLARSAAVLAELDGRPDVTLHDLRHAGSELNRHLLDNLAERLDCRGRWHDLAVVPATTRQLTALERRCRHRERVLDHLGHAFRNGTSRGVRALFTGPSGTGKTLAAKILAARLEIDLYRVDLASIVNKYIGETEKNLQQVLARAEALDVVLLLDEGDALLGGRTEVKSATDRYANLQTNYLLQRLEHYQGIVLVTTNLGDNIDRAFKRRMDAVVPFFLPGAEERAAILDLHLPEDHTVSLELLEQVALRSSLSGGQLRNAAMQASLLALDDEEPVGDEQLEAALRAEHEKAGGTDPLSTCPLHGNGRAEPTAEQDMDAFVSALSGP